jgi:hypothetical protein
VLSGPIYLTDVLVGLGLIQSLPSVRCFTTNNSCYMEFGPFGLSVKDLAIQSVNTKYNTSSPLYTLRLPSSTTFIPDASPYALVVVASSSTRHRCLNHSDPGVVSMLSHSSVIMCPRATDDSMCHSCQLGKHVRLPFPSSLSAFDLIHCDLWTSHVLSVSAYEYYMVILEDCTHYSWTFPPPHKSDPFSTLSLICLRVHVVWTYHPECLVRQRPRVR